MNERARVSDSGYSSSSREAGVQAGMWQFPLASSHLAEVQMRKQNKKAGVWMIPIGREGIRSVSGKLAAVFSMSAPAET